MQLSRKLAYTAVYAKLADINIHIWACVGAFYSHTEREETSKTCAGLYELLMNPRGRDERRQPDCDTHLTR